MHIKVNDLVVVIAGSSKDKGKQGKVTKVLRNENRVIVEGVNIITKHLRPNNVNPEGGIDKKEGPINASNVMLVDPKTKTRTRIGYEVIDGKKVRVTKKSGSVLDK